MTDIVVKQPEALSPSDWQLWNELQRQPVYESPYFRAEFMQAVAAVRDDCEIAVLRRDEATVGFLPFQRGKLNLGKPIGGKLSDYHGPLLAPGVNFDPQQVLSATGLVSWDFDHLACLTTAFDGCITHHDRSPQIDLHDGFEAYARGRREAGSDCIPNQVRKNRKLVREVGPLQFIYDAADDESFALLRRWKSAQYLRSGLADVFAYPWALELLRRLRTHPSPDFSAPLSVLRAGDQVAAIALSLRSRGVLHAWFTTYNPELAAYSPGVALFIRLAEEAASLGITKIDFGKGPERYKWSLASTSAPVAEGAITCPALATWLRSGWRAARRWAEQSKWASRVAWPGKLVKPLRQWLAYH